MTTNRSMIQKSLIPGVHEFVGLSYGATPEEHKPFMKSSILDALLKKKCTYQEWVVLK